MLKIFVLFFITNINFQNAHGKFLPKSTYYELSLPDGSGLSSVTTEGHNIEKRDAGYGSQTSGVSTAVDAQPGRTISMADVKLITMLIFTKLKENFKVARVGTKTWTDFIMALLSATKNAVTDSVTEFVIYKTKQKLQETVQSYPGGAATLGVLGRIGGFMGWGSGSKRR